MAAVIESVFYSWQSDSLSRFNRNFIEEAIKEALQNVKAGTALDPSPRDPKLEKDTFDVPGSPSITDTILRKIDKCSVFVADLTAVGQLLPQLSKNRQAKSFPNSNVVMEYGYALKSVGDTRIIAVTNEAVGGEIREGNLPFNLRHRRWPIRYSYGPTTKSPQKEATKKQLVADLTRAIDLILREPRETGSNPASFVGTKFGPEMFIEQARAHELIIDGPFGGDIPQYEIPTRGILCLSLQPLIRVPEFESEIDAMDAASLGHLRPMAKHDIPGYSPGRNASGGIVFRAPVDGNLLSFTQLFLNKELFGLDAFSSGANSWRAASERHAFFDVNAVEESFALTLHKYAGFAMGTLALPSPWKVRAGVFGVKGLRMGRGSGSLTDEILWESSMTNDASVADTLEPFFNRLWKRFGAQRGNDSRLAIRGLLDDIGSIV